MIKKLLVVSVFISVFITGCDKKADGNISEANKSVSKASATDSSENAKPVTFQEQIIQMAARR
jgi:hypothetical protein